jgi:hypothetical protein
MRRSMWLWRVRRNPLRRRSYAVQAWAFLAVGLIAVVSAVLVGVSVARDLQSRYAQQRVGHYRTTAVLTRNAPGGYSVIKVRAPARWKAPDGTTRAGTVKVEPGLPRGAVLRVWTDGRGALVPTTLSAPAAQFQADLIAASIASGICATALIGCGITARLTARRRSASWAADWAAADARWGNRNV